MRAELTLIPTATIHPGKIAIYNEVHWQPFKPSRDRTGQSFEEANAMYSHLLESSRTAQGKVSKIAKRKINKTLDYLLFLTNNKTVTNSFTGRTFQFKIAFITLTLPSKQLHSDNEIKSKCLNQFLIEIKKHYKVKNYIWRAELQKNDNIHFHILVDKFIPYQEIRDRWNRIINKLNYVDNYRKQQQLYFRDGFKVRKELLPTWSKEKQLEAYNRGARLHWNSPNSTDVHSIRKIWNIKQYISKYMTKPPAAVLDLEPREIAGKIQQGRIWGCNSELNNITGARVTIDTEIEHEIASLQAHAKTHTFQQPYFAILSFDIKILLYLKCVRLIEIFTNYIAEAFFKNILIEFKT